MFPYNNPSRIKAPLQSDMLSPRISQPSKCPSISGSPGALYPPAFPVPPDQARKRAGRGKNPFLFAMLFEKNIEIFSDPNPSVLCVFSICPPRFRAWTLGAGREAGSWQSDALQSHEHDIPTYAGISGTRATLIDDKGNLNQSNITLDVGRFYTYPTGPSGRIAAESRPVNISVPAILYLGLPA